MTDRALLVQLEGYGLTTAEICYFMPDHPSLLQIYAWQEYDAAPDFPVLFDFLAHWRREIEAEIRSVRIAHEKDDPASELAFGGWRDLVGLAEPCD